MSKHQLLQPIKSPEKNEEEKMRPTPSQVMMRYVLGLGAIVLIGTAIWMCAAIVYYFATTHNCDDIVIGTGRCKNY